MEDKFDFNEVILLIGAACGVMAIAVLMSDDSYDKIKKLEKRVKRLEEDVNESR